MWREILFSSQLKHFPCKVANIWEDHQPLKLATDVKVFLFVDQSMSSFSVSIQCSVDTQLETHKKISDVQYSAASSYAAKGTKSPTHKAEQKTLPVVSDFLPGKAWCSFHLWGCRKVWCTLSRTSPSRCGARTPQTPPQSGWWTMFS